MALAREKYAELEGVSAWWHWADHAATELLGRGQPTTTAL